MVKDRLSGNDFSGICGASAFVASPHRDDETGAILRYRIGDWDARRLKAILDTLGSVATVA